MNQFETEIYQQPEALRALVAFYQQPDGRQLLAEAALDSRPLFTGMGASWHAARLAALRCHSRGVAAAVIQAIDAIDYNTAMLANFSQIVYISQSGASGEIEPLHDALQRRFDIAITNDIDSPLGYASDMALPVMAGDEQTVATKTYINTQAVLHLLLGGDVDVLKRVADRIDALLQADDSQLWLNTLRSARHIYCLGHGMHAVTASQVAMMLGEWAKLPATPLSIGAFRHGFIEVIQPEDTVLIFAPAGPTQQSALRLGEELHGYGARVLLTESGVARPVEAVSSRSGSGDTVREADAAQDDFTAPMLDIIPVELFMQAYTRENNIMPAFRYIDKVVRNI